jgi:flagellar protein FlbD
MIRLTRINGDPIVVNSDLIEHVETTPDTILTLTNGQKLMVKESANDVVERVVAFRRSINLNANAGRLELVLGGSGMERGSS